MKTITVLVAPPGAGKTTWREAMLRNDPSLRVISQDDQGKDHFRLFNESLILGESIVIDRMNFNKVQRERYLKPAKEAGYSTMIIILHENSRTCLERMANRKGHLTIQDAKSAGSALHTFFKNYERPEDSEADVVIRKYSEREKPLAVICDLDGTLCGIEHRRHFVQRTGKKDWRGFLANMDKDHLNVWCAELVSSMASSNYKIVYCSGRGEEYRDKTLDWLIKHEMNFHSDLFMRQAGDSRSDYLIKENILDFEILSLYTPIFMIDDRSQVVNMWRKRGFICLQCDEGNF